MILGKRKSAATAPPHKKRRKSASAIEEITFDFTAREDYLSGFHKRKVQRIKQAKEEAIKKDREEKVVARKILRDNRKADLEKHVETVNSMIRDADGQLASLREKDDVVEEEQRDGIGGVPEVDHEAEYFDEDRFTTVTVEAVDISKDGLHKIVKDDDEENAEIRVQDAGKGVSENPIRGDRARGEGGKRIWTKERPGEPKKKKKKFKYESKADRKFTRHKERSGNSAKAKARKE